MNSTVPISMFLDKACLLILGTQELIKELLIEYKIKLV